MRLKKYIQNPYWNISNKDELNYKKMLKINTRPQEWQAQDS